MGLIRSRHRNVIGDSRADAGSAHWKRARVNAARGRRLKRRGRRRDEHTDGDAGGRLSLCQILV